MHCRRARRELLLRSDDRLSFERELALASHLENCDACRAFESTLEHLDETLARWPEPASDRLDVDASLSVIRDRVAAEATPIKSVPRGRRTAALVAAAALAIVVGVLGWRALQQRVADEQTQTAERSRLAEGDASPQPEELAGGPTPDSRATTPEPGETQLAVQDTPAEPIDPERVQVARAFLLTTLTALEPKLPRDASTEKARAFATDVDRALRAGGSWPWRRMSERLLHENDVALVRSAARYVGIGADRMSITVLASALEQPEHARPLALALRDAGATTHPSLAAALRDPERSAAVHLVLDDLPASERIELLDLALRGGSPDEADSTMAPDLLAALSASGPAALPALIEAGARGDATEDELVQLLASEAWASDALLGAAWRAQRSDAGELTLLLCARVSGVDALDPLEQQLVDGDLHAGALRGFAAVGGSAAFERLVDLHSAGHLEFDEVDAALHAVTDADPLAPHRALAFAAEESTNSGDASVARLLAGWILSLETPSALPALHLLANDVRFDPELRRDALLAIGELGGYEDVEQLITVFGEYRSRERRLAAACLIAIHKLDGEAAAEHALAGDDPRTTRSVLTALRQSRRRDRELSTHRLARALSPLLDQRGTALERSEP